MKNGRPACFFCQEDATEMKPESPPALGTSATQRSRDGRPPTVLFLSRAHDEAESPGEC